ncbi:NAD(P)-binding protein [Pseudovirgaria hyperparasitica]|uniref:NAD(P)-binding protein n=1 Tax=Pseudovirgaria hyperparasitica TaxID=470096 RepID=A0A6A6W588_9PEZI|nr:NAD(P)-binding protein [Pseudovirgaria hyperparasitica]KAF2757763.1 NAD(P)-binding protein [Pseudovirgaria hyperparasitica]
MAKRLQGKVAIVTGSSSGLGRAIATAFATEGAQVCCVDLYPGLRNAIDPETGKADSYHNRITTGIPTHESLPASSSGKPHIFVRADMTVAGDVEAAVVECVKVYGRLDFMCNNAGITVESTHTRVMRVHETSEDDYDRTMAINAKGVFLGCKYAVRQMLLQPRSDDYYIVNTASIQGLVGYLGTPSYCASKGAVVQLTKQIALDYGPERIHCNALCPGFLKTAMTQNLQSEPEILASISAAHPLGGMGNPEDVARAAVFLASSDARWITGVPLAIDGGYTVQ